MLIESTLAAIQIIVFLILACLPATTWPRNWACPVLGPAATWRLTWGFRKAATFVAESVLCKKKSIKMLK